MRPAFVYARVKAIAEGEIFLIKRLYSVGKVF